MTIEHDANGMPVAVSREYAARCQLLEFCSRPDMGVYDRLCLQYVREDWGWFWSLNGIGRGNRVAYDATVSIDINGLVRILEWRDHRGEAK